MQFVQFNWVFKAAIAVLIDLPTPISEGEVWCRDAGRSNSSRHSEQMEEDHQLQSISSESSNKCYYNFMTIG